MIFDCWCTNLLSIAVALVTITIAYYKWSYQYWKKRNLPYFEPSIPYGNLTSPFSTKENPSVYLGRVYNEMKAKGWKHGGLYAILSPTYLVIDLDYLKNIMSRDFHYFTDRGFYYNEEHDPLGAHLFALGGQKWQNMRRKLSPTFTSGKMKMMFQILVDCIPNFLETLESDRVKNIPIDIKELLGCYGTDIIGSVAFGLECHSFEDKNSPFRLYGYKFFNPSMFTQLKNLIGFGFPNFAKKIGLVLTPKESTEFFLKLIKDTVSYREQNNIERKDFLQLLIDLKNNNFVADDGSKSDGHTLSIEEIAAQSFVFFVAGYETSSTTVTFTLYELAKNQDIQQKVRDEINTVLTKHDGKITYDAIQEMKYMDQVINESLRKYPPVAILTRECVKDYKIPDEDVIIEKGTLIFIPVYGIHHDEEYYPDPEKFDPERFSEENKSKRHHFAHIPFGEGPRLCIGMRFGLMQSKVALTALLKNYKLTVNKKTVEPLKMNVRSIVLAIEGDLWLNAEKIKQ